MFLSDCLASEAFMAAPRLFLQSSALFPDETKRHLVGLADRFLNDLVQQHRARASAAALLPGSAGSASGGNACAAAILSTPTRPTSASASSASASASSSMRVGSSSTPATALDRLLETAPGPLPLLDDDLQQLYVYGGRSFRCAVQTLLDFIDKSAPTLAAAATSASTLPSTSFPTNGSTVGGFGGSAPVAAAAGARPVAVPATQFPAAALSGTNAAATHAAPAARSVQATTSSAPVAQQQQQQQQEQHHQQYQERLQPQPCLAVAPYAYRQRGAAAHTGSLVGGSSGSGSAGHLYEDEEFGFASPRGGPAGGGGEAPLLAALSIRQQQPQQ